MRRLSVFETVSVDGYFTDEDNDMSWAHAGEPDAEWDDFVAGNASRGGVLLFGRVTYEMMAGWWPTPAAARAMPVVAQRMNEREKIVFSRTLGRADWANTTLIGDDAVTAVRRLKKEAGGDMVVLGSGSIVAQLAAAGLIDELQLVVKPILLGAGRTPFDGMPTRRSLERTSTREFRNGNVVSYYRPVE